MTPELPFPASTLALVFAFDAGPLLRRAFAATLLLFCSFGRSFGRFECKEGGILVSGGRRGDGEREEGEEIGEEGEKWSGVLLLPTERRFIHVKNDG